MTQESAENRAVRRWIYARSEGQRRRLLLLTAGRVVQGGIFVLLSLFTRGLIDSAVAGELNDALRNGACLLTTILFSIALRTGLAILLRTVEYRMTIALRMRTYQLLGRKKQAALYAYQSGELLDRIDTDTPHVIESLVSIVPDAAGMAANLIGALIALYAMSGPMTLLLILFGLTVAFAARFMRKRVRAYYRDMSERGAKVSAYYFEILSHSLLVRIFGAQERAMSKAKALEQDSYSAWRRWLVFNQTIKTGSSVFFQIGYFGALLLGANALFHQTLSYGSLTAILQLVSQIQDPFTEIGYMTALYNTSYAAAERMIELENLPDEPEAPAFDPEDIYSRMTALRAERLTFGYHEDETVLKDCSFTLRKGDFVVVAGPSGAGKSTLEKLILGVYDDFEGSLYLELGGEAFPLCAGTRRLFGYVPQGDMVLSGTIMDNLTFLLGEVDAQALDEALTLSCAKEFLSQLPNGLDTVIGEHGVGLSEGQNQRLAIARALLSRAPILLMDEATSALDADTEKRVLNNLRGLKDKTILMISHKEAVNAVCDVELRLENGRITQRRVSES